MLSPKRTKFQKYQKRITIKTKNNTQSLVFGKYGIKSTGGNWRFQAKTIEAVRRVIRRTFKRHGKIWIRVFPDMPVTKKPAEVRMGKGKGSLHFWAAKIAAGEILVEFDGVSQQQAYEAFLAVRDKVPAPIQFVQFD